MKITIDYDTLTDLSVTDLSAAIRQVNEANGWSALPKDAIDVAPEALNSRLMLVVGEVAEASEVIRDVDGTMADFELELADVVIRALDLANMLGIDMADVIAQKVIYNSKRPHRHGKRI